MAMALGATVLVALFGAYEAVTDAGMQIRTLAEKEREVRVAIGIIEDDLRSLTFVEGAKLAVLVPGDTQGSDAMGDVLLSITTSATLDFAASLPHKGVQRVQYVFEQGARYGRLVRRERVQAGIVGDFDWSELTLVDDLREMDVRFWSREFGGYSRNWSPTDYTDLPRAVRLSFVRESKDGERSYDFVVPLAPALEEG